MYRIAHISDTHIKNLNQHEEYRTIFSQMYEELRERKPDYIVHCGDLAHTKTQLSPEYFDLAADFLKNLADIAKTIVILGNHDGNLKNDDRQDAVTPIVQALAHPDLHLIKDSGEFHVDDNLCFNVLSIFDEENWKEISNSNKINIALYHGAIFGVVTDTGYVLEHGDHDVSIFKGFDYAMLGDIHRTNQELDPEGRVRYCGSTVQQNFGETNDKGFLVWDIENKDKFSVEHVAIPNPRPFVTVELDDEGKLPDIRIPKNSQLRIQCNTHLSSNDIKRAIDIAKKTWLPEKVTVKNVPGKKLSVQEVSGTYSNENLRDIAVQEKLIAEYLKDYNLDKNSLDKVLELNRKYNTLAEQDEEVGRNVRWSVKGIRWNNTFNYGENNSINFDSLNGIVGIFGPNYSGKSSIPDTKMWSMYNTVSKNVTKNVDIINQNKQEASTEIDIQIDDRLYTIARGAEKYTKKLKGVETIEAKTSVDFSYLDLNTQQVTSLNGIDRKETDANIRKIFGTADDYLQTSMNSQHGSMSFINEGSTKRKEILGKFLDLDIFSKKHKLAKSDSAGIKTAIKKMEEKNFADEIMQAEKNIILTDQQLEEKREIVKQIKQQLEEKQEEMAQIRIKEATGPQTSFIDIKQVEQDIKKRKDTLSQIEEKEQELKEQISNNEKIISQINRTLKQYDWEKLQDDKGKLEELNKESIHIDAKIKALNTDIENKKAKLAILDTVPCGDSYPKCRFLIDANTQKEKLPETEKQLLAEEKIKRAAEEQIEDLGESVFQLNEYEKLEKNKAEVQEYISETNLKLQKILNHVPVLQSELSNLEEKSREYYENEEWMLKLADIEKEKNNVSSHISSLQENMKAEEEMLAELSTNKGILTQKVVHLEEQKKDLQELREEYNAYDLFQSCMHSNGIVYDIIKKKLPLINQEISKILTSIVNFDVFLEDDGKKLDMYIKHPKYEPRPLELGSGAEKSIAAIAIRLGLIKTSSLPVGDLFIMDEPATALDEENMEGFTRILQMLKTSFKTVMLISHLDALKDVVDMQITINKIDGFAHVEI